MEKENQLIFIDEEGNEVLCEILFTFESKEFNKNYVLFYPIASEDSEDIEIMAASYVPDKDGNGELQAIETDEEWDLIEDVLAQFDEEHDHDCDCQGEGCEDHDHDCEEHEHKHAHDHKCGCKEHKK